MAEIMTLRLVESRSVLITLTGNATMIKSRRALKGSAAMTMRLKFWHFAVGRSRMFHDAAMGLHLKMPSKQQTTIQIVCRTNKIMRLWCRADPNTLRYKQSTLYFANVIITT